METKDVIYYGNCEHLDSYGDIRRFDCKKRYYEFYDIENNKTKYIAICNDNLRLMVQNEIHLDKKDEPLYYKKWRSIEKVLKDICLKYCYQGLSVLNINPNEHNKKDINDFNIEINLLKDGNCRVAFNLLEALKFLLYEYKDPKYNTCIYHKFYPLIIHRLYQYAEMNKKYAKHKTHAEFIFKSLKKFDNAYHYEDKQILLNELFLQIINLKTKKL